MTLTSTLTKKQYNGDDSTTAFPTVFKFWDNTDIKVIHLDATGVETTWVEGTDYTLTGGSGSNGTVTATVAPATGETLTIKSNRSDTQDDALPPGGPFPSPAVEQALDQTVRLIQQKEEELSRAVTLTETSAAANLTFPDPVEGKGIKFSGGEIVVTTGDIESLATDAAASAAAAAASAAAASTSAEISASEIVLWNFDSSTSMADPGTADVRLNNATLASVTQIAISALTAASGNPDLSDFIMSLDDSTSAIKGSIIFRNADTPGAFAIFSINAAITDNTTWLQIPVDFVDSNGSFTDTDTLHIDFSAKGDVGSSIDVTTKGDLQTFSTVTARLPVGANGLRLTPDSGETTGLKWVNHALILAKSTTYTVAVADQGKVLFLSGASFTVTLLSAATAGSGFLIGFKHGGTSAQVYTIDGNGAETIDGQLTQALSRIDESFWLVSDGGAWNLVSSGGRGVSIVVQLFGNDVAVEVATGLALVPVPFQRRLIDVHAEVATAGTTGVTTIDINKNGTTMLSTKLTIDSGETGSDTAAAAAVISVPDIAEHDVITLDVDGISAAAPIGLTVSMRFL